MQGYRTEAVAEYPNGGARTRTNMQGYRTETVAEYPNGGARTRTNMQGYRTSHALQSFCRLPTFITQREKRLNLWRFTSKPFTDDGQ